jgi:hypothetical protein
MKFIFAILILGLGIAGLIGGSLYPQYISEIFLGMLAPLLVSIISILQINNVGKKDPQKITAAITKSFLFKMIFFAIYIIIILSIYAFEPIPFVISFTGFFILFYVIEAVFLQKLFQSGK